VIPTAKLRWIKKPASLDMENCGWVGVLQQWWIPYLKLTTDQEFNIDRNVGGEWRDVPVEAE
jgi:hypothetical protein